MAIITLLTDFGTVDSYVAGVKAALLSCAPDATLVDITHPAPRPLVAPDKGLLAFLPRDARFVALAEPRTAAPTFHGRDLFAPAAAALANAASLEAIGKLISDPD